MRRLLDTNRYEDLMGRVPIVVERFSEAAEVWLSLVTVGELRAGFRHGSRYRRNEQQLADMLQVRGVRVLVPDDETTDYYGRTYALLKRSGRLIPTNDVWIAAQALQHNLTLDTWDEHFERVPGLRLVEA